MGIYHLMGLGQSPGAITSPLSYLAYRYKRWNESDRAFFSRSGEASQRERGEKVGDVQAIVLFTTAEVLAGVRNGKSFHSYPFIDNQAKSTNGQEQDRAPMKGLLRSLLPKTGTDIFGQRQSIEVFWCEIDRKNIKLTYGRIIQVIAALSAVGGQGKELWINLTGGNNVTNFALQLASTLSGEVARLYYVQAQNDDAVKCVRFTTEDDYWIELPVMPLVLSDLGRAVLTLLEEQPGLGEETLYSCLQNHRNYWSLVNGVSKEQFRAVALTSLWKQGLIQGQAESYYIDSQWTLIQDYEGFLKKAKSSSESVTLEKMALQQTWIEREAIDLK